MYVRHRPPPRRALIVGSVSAISTITQPLNRPVSQQRIFSTWWPLAASWLFMGLELPLVSAVMARLADPTIHLAAYGGVVFPVALIVEAPVIMLLAASTALSRDLASYRKMYRFMMWTGGLLTLLHAAIAFTPLFDIVVVGLIDPPAAIIEPARLGLMIMLPWTWTIAYRRFHQGVLIRFGRPKAVTIGTAIRFAAVITALLITTTIGGLPGIVVATIAIAAGVSAEAVYTGFRAHPIIHGPLTNAPVVTPPLNWTDFYSFYIPLALTSLLLLAVQPLGSATISRMPRALESLAVWPVLNGLLFMLRSLGYAYNEVVVALMDERGAFRSLRRFTVLLASGVLLLTLAIAATPLSHFWFVTVSGLSEDLADLARTGLWLGLLWPALDAVRNYYQGTIMFGRRTRSITESVVVFLVVSSALLFVGVALQTFPGIAVALVSFIAGTLAQLGWLWWRSRPIIAALNASEPAEEMTG